ncbi:MAG TPA: diaminopimelate decarboxylase [Melioribacteraceae bacterium]|nr:diaminopimelate decarboxylase [Melioribacteraceae bacterium]
MSLIESDFFYYINNELYCENIKINDIVDTTKTPVYVYSKKAFQNHYKLFSEAFKDINHTIFYALKSNYNLNVIKIFEQLGAGCDVNSAGEFIRALKGGFTPDRILLTGVGKTYEEIKMGIDLGVKMIKAESWQELEAISNIATELGKKVPVAIRVNPNVDPKTHPYISTGLKENKFGVPYKDALQYYHKANELPNIELKGLDMHIGSQITVIEPFVEAVTKIKELLLQLRDGGIVLEHFDMGGGMGVPYKNEHSFSPFKLAAALMPIFKDLNMEIFFEPGRYLTANAGVLIGTVLYTKVNNEKHFIVTDTAMTDLLRPSIYNAYHHIQPVINKNKDIVTADIVGPVCESGDFLGKSREIQKLEQNDRIAVLSAGAYGMVMSSNYNGRRRPPEIIVDGDKFFITRSRETYDYLLYDEKLIEELHQ